MKFIGSYRTSNSSILLFIAIIFSLLLSTCGITKRFTAKIEQNQEKWTKQEIATYRLEVLVVNSIWHAQTIQVEVNDNQVVAHSATCVPAPAETGSCEIQPYEAGDFTVPGLFAHASDLAENHNQKWVKIEFNTQFGYPDEISFDDPQILDEDTSWHVASFEVKP